MPRLFPPDPDFPDGFHGERAVWEALRDQLPDEAVLFRSIPLIEGAKEREIDLLVAWPGAGIAVIEVKGGNVWKDDAGAWHVSSGGGERRIEDPAEQVQDARHLLQSYLRRRGSGPAAVASSRTAHLVALPFTEVPQDWSAPNLARTMVVDRHELGHVAARVLHAIDAHGAGHKPLSAVEAQILVDVVASSLPRQVDSIARAAEQRAVVEQLTRDQAHLLTQFLSHQSRARVIGGAGTGKTWVATAQARRLARSGRRVALVCYSRGLGRFFERLVATWPARDRPAYVGLFHDLPIRWGAEPGADDDSDYWERRLPEQLGTLAATRPAGELFDAVVVDEAQDFSDIWWPNLLQCLRDPERGGLYVFLDDGQRVFPRNGHDPIELPPFQLEENLRNTKQIAQLIGSMSQVAMRPRGAPGEPVRVVDVVPEEAVEVADDAVEALLGEGWDPGHVALLTTGRRHPEQRHSVELAGYQEYWDDFLAGEDVFYGHVLGFKGLERPVVVLCVNGFRDLERAREILYTGLSRASSLLVVVGPRALVEEIGGEGARRRLAGAQQWTVTADVP
ncbi:nuclease-related domain-containing DEAD/DEAH box helicase [Georgenia daeguensis]|uniref:ATP-binding domain-containing protein n=1 Tax=Georgenia daeguensis TaxID=908355 RepID=A0ABP8EVB1_9MICO